MAAADPRMVRAALAATGGEMTLLELRAKLHTLHAAHTTLALVRQQDPKAWNMAAQNQFNRALKTVDWKAAVDCLDAALEKTNP